MKFKEKTKKRIRGSITVLMVIIMLPMMTMSAVIVDSSRINMARSMVSSAGDLAMNTALANYDTILKDVYGLFAMSQNMTDDDLSKSLKDYFSTTLVSYGVTNKAEAGDYVDALIGDFKDIISSSKNGQASNFLDMNIVDFTATKVDNSSLANSNILRSQIVEYMKYRAPLNFGLSFLDSINAFKNVQSQTTVVQTQVVAQESTQDVTSACKTAIESIRTYDKLIDSIKNGDKVVKGKTDKSDNQNIDISEYHTQVDKYCSTWGDNYSHTNKLNLVFLLKSPSVSSRYLKNLNINSSQWFIKTDNTGIIYDNTGININVSVASETNEAKNQVYSQINKLKDGNGTENKTQSAYKTKKYLDGKDKTLANGTTFSDEEKAIETFIAFENFLTDNGDVKYSDVKTTLESIYTLGKYYDNYNSKITADIEKAEKAMNDAKEKVTTADSNVSTYYNAISKNVGNINTANKNYTISYDFLIGIKNSDNEDLYTVINTILAQNNVALPTSTKTINGKSFTQFGNFVKNTYKENVNDSDNKYLKVFKEIIGSSLKNDDDNKAICDAASSYLKDKANNKTKKLFGDYIKSKAGNSALETDLYKLLAHLYKNKDYVSEIENNISLYNSVKDNYAGYVSDVQEKTSAYNKKVSEKDQVNSDYKHCLSLYYDFVNEYQNDLVYYEKYINTAKSIITNKVVAVNKQFTAIKTNVESIIDQLETIETNLSTAWTAINTYNDNLDKWKSANDTYAANSGKDSFSQQNSADIETSKSQYDLKSLETLQTYVASIKGEYQDFYDRITDETHFKYGSKKIDAINTADLMKSAVPSGVKDSLPAVVTSEVAIGKLGELYNSEATGSIEMDNWYFLDPVLPMIFLKYLNETYPETAPSTSQTVNVDGQDVTVGKNSGDFNYESTKSSLTSNSGGEISDDTDTDKFGYSYKGKSIDKSDVPSKKKSGKEGDANSKFKVGTKDDDGDINVSGGFSAQNSTLGTILSGIGDIATNTLENTYILSYIFNNFSYNTLIQDEVLKKESDKTDGLLPFPAITAANNLFVAGETTFDSVKDKTTTLSNYLKNGNNNYFYGAEIEYLLYGNAKAETNVKYTKASIYAIRFAFNCIYAFTNSEIRNSTMSVGLAVQAATCGIVPYQIVQIVLQLALAAAESAVDLNMMNCGLKVAIVKTKETWSLSISGAVKSAGQIVGNVAEKVVENAVTKVSSGLQGLVDAGADKLNESITDLNNNLASATQGKLEEITDSAFAYIQSKVEDVLNELQYEDYNGKTATEIIDNAFAKLESSLSSEVTSKFGGNPVADAILPDITGKINSILSSVKSDLNTKITGLEKEDAIRGAIVSAMTEIKINMITCVSNAIEELSQRISDKVTDLTSEISNELKGYIDRTAGEISEEVSETIKEEVTNATNDFIGKYLDDGATDAIGSGVGGSSSTSVASMIKFGYKDYLMLFVFISLCANPDDNATIARIADLIEVNIQKASTNEATGLQNIKDGIIKHQKGSSFKMANAKTYIAINSNIKLEMLFMNLDLFANMVSDETDTKVSGQLTPAATIEYNGLYGY